MEELEAKLNQIKIDLKILEESNELFRRQSSILDCFDRVYKEVI